MVGSENIFIVGPEPIIDTFVQF